MLHVSHRVHLGRTVAAITPGLVSTRGLFLQNRFPILACFWLCLFSSLVATAQVSVYTRSYDNARTSANLNETILTPANVNANTFGKLFTVPVDGEPYAQPLYVANLAIAGGTHNVVFVATMLNSVYAIDADNGAVLWTKNFGMPISAVAAQSYNGQEFAQNISNITGVGIVSTPVIDPATNIMYFVTSFQYQDDGATQYARLLNALDITTGAPFGPSPVNITATYSTPDLTTPLVFNPLRQNNRPGLALANGNVYIAFASHDDIPPYNGWVLAYSASTLAQVAVFSDTTSGSLGGIWSAGQAPAVDSAGNLYFSTGNGSFGATANNLQQTGNSFIKLSPTLQLLDYFTPFDSAAMNSGDADLGSSGLLLVPNTTYALGGGKQGILYLADTTALGGFHAGGDQVHQEFQAIYGKGTSHIHGTPSYFNSPVNGPTAYVWGENDVLRAYAFNATTGLMNPTPVAMSPMTAPVVNNNGAMPGGFTSISANGNSNGILWASTPYNGDAAANLTQGVLYAFDANTLKLLWTDKTNDARDEIGVFAKYVQPIVANGKMYIPNFTPVNATTGSGNLVVYGLLKPQLTVAVTNASSTVGAALPTLTGTVTGLVNGDTLGSTIIVTYTTTATAGSPAGTYPITATVTGSSAGNYDVDVAPGTLTIAPAPVLTVTANNATRAYGAANPAFTGTVTGAQGSDTFTESFATTATVASNVGSYPIVPSVTGTNLGNYTVTPVDGALTVIAEATATALSAPSTAAPGASITLTALVTAVYGAPAGTVTFYSGPTSLGTAVLNGTGVATLTTTALPTGTDAVTAAYGAAGNFASSTSPVSSVVVSPGAQTITFPAIAAHAYGSAPFAVTATSSLGSAYPVTITVQSGPALINGGIVTVTGLGAVALLATQAGDVSHSAATATQSFQVTPAPLSVSAGNATRAYGAANPVFTGTITGAVGSDSFTETFTTTAAATSNVGSYPIVPAVAGASLGNYTVTLVNGSLAVTAASTTTTLSAPATAVSGASVTLTATVASSPGAAAGTVTFQSGSTALGTAALSGGNATLSINTLPVGADTVTATYAAAGNYAGSTSPGVVVTVTAAPAPAPPSYTVAANPTSLTIAAGSTGSTTLTVTPTGGYAGTIAWTCTSLPANATCSFAQSQVAITASTQSVTTGLTINTTVQQSQSKPSLDPLLALAFWWPGSLTGLALFARRRKLAWLGLSFVAIGLAGCGSGAAFHQNSTPAPATSQVTVVAAGTAGTAVSTKTLTLTLTLTQ